MRTLTAVTFDLWQTLIIDTPEIGRPRAELRMRRTVEALADAGYRYAPQQAMDAFRRCSTQCGDVRENEGDVTFGEQVRLFLQLLDPDMAEHLPPEARRAVERAYTDSYLDHPPLIDEHAATVLSRLKREGYRLGLICNTGSTPGFTQRSFLADQGLAHYFDTLTFSDEERLSKPAARIFHLTLERLGVTPNETVHVGDHPRNDVEGAKRAGLAAVWLARESKEPSVRPDARVESLADVVEAVAALAERASIP
jgi:HAD superfamily hydrolase (TIGR01509 family)